MKSLVYLLATIVALLMINSMGHVQAALVVTDFEPAGFVVGGSVHNILPDGTTASPAVNYTNWAPPAWAVMYAARTAPVDEEIVDLGGAHGKVWRYSTGLEDGNLGATPKSHHAGFVAGETGALNDAGMGVVTTNTFYGQVDFRSVTMAPQTGLQIRLSASSMDQRHGYLTISDDGSGFDLGFWRADLDSYDILDTNLSYTDWHTLGIEILFNDGASNDVVNLWVNGSMIYSGPSWEAYYTDHAESVDRLSFDTYLDTSHSGKGLYFDNVLISDEGPGGVIPEPASFFIWSLLITFGVSVGRWRHRNHA